ncbi:hypothetical protein BKA69DRAFT_1049441 [Paraphysoderma sedebokerense]|nr:hypothetical protein BKA69DRAFT_1049441 [Paraphysoderma sedebokerense]
MYDLHCLAENGDVSIHLKNVSIVKEWPKKMFIMFGYHWNCGEDVSVHWRMVRSRSIIDKEYGIVLLRTKKVDFTDVVTKSRLELEFLERLDLEKYHILRPIPSSSHLFPHSDERSLEPATRLDRRSDFSNVNLNFNYNEKTKSAENPFDRPLDRNLKWNCYNCYTKGSGKIIINAQEVSPDGKRYRLDFQFEGNLMVNVDYKLEATSFGSWQKDFGHLITIPLGPFQVPGLFNVGHNFYVSSGVSIAVNDTAILHQGFEAHFPELFIKVYKPHHELNPIPIIESSGTTPEIVPHDFDTPRALLLTMGFRLTPGVNFGISMGPINAGIALDFDHFLYADIEDSTGDICPEGMGQVSFKNQNSMVVRAFGQEKFIAGTERRLMCPTCGFCLGPGSKKGFQMELSGLKGRLEPPKTPNPPPPPS